MKKILTFVFTLLTFVTYTQTVDVKKATVRDWIIYQGDTLAITSISGDTIFVTRGGTLDTLIAGGVNHWDLTGSDIVNNNSGKVTIDSLHLYPLPPLADKIGRIPVLQTNGLIEWCYPIDLFNEMQDTTAASPTAYTTWVRDSTNGYIYPVRLTDKVGIGTVTPAYSLDIKGNLRVIKNLTVPNYGKFQTIVYDSLGLFIRRQTHRWTGAIYASGGGGFGIGDYALYNNTGSGAIGIGDYSCYENTAAAVMGIGHYACYGNTGTYAQGFGYEALRSNLGEDAIGLGFQVMYSNTGRYSLGFGYSALKFNNGDDVIGIGYQANYYNNSDNVIKIGRQTSGSPISYDTLTVKTFTSDSIILASDLIHIPSHGFGAAHQSAYAYLRFNVVSGTPPTGLSNGNLLRIELVHADTLGYNFTDVGNGVFTFTDLTRINNSIAIGNDVFPTDSNQVIIGDADITETILRGTVIAGDSLYSDGNAEFNADVYVTSAIKMQGATLTFSGGGGMGSDLDMNAYNIDDADSVNTGSISFTDPTVWMDSFRKAPFYFTDFLHVGTSSNDPWLGTAISSGIIGGASVSLTGHPGTVRIISSTTTNSGYMVMTTANMFYGVTANSISNLVFYPNVLDSVTTRFGFHDATTVTAPVDGAYFEIGPDSVLWGKTMKASAGTTTGTGYTLSVNTWYRLKLVVNSNATRIDYYLYNMAGTQLWTNNITTNIPDDALAHGFITTKEHTGTGTGITVINVDYMDVYLGTLVR